MKFHCDRCKTKYSISDDRVRGKILKIRCKNCSAVITVREAGAQAEKPAGAESTGAKAQNAGKQALAGAFKQAVTEANHIEPGGSGSSAPPVSLEAEWYLSKDGEQEGPFSLQQARAWVQSKAADDELHCWSEGYDDWLPTDKVSHFRSLRRPPTAPSAGAHDELPTVADEPGSFAEDTPQPLFAATMQAVESQAAGAASEMDILSPKKSATGPFDSIPQAQRGNNGASAPPIPTAAKPAAKPAATPRPVAGLIPAASEDGESLEFDIGEASRVVDLPALLAARGNAPVRPNTAIHQGGRAPTAAPTLGQGTGQESALGARAASAGVGYATGPNMTVGNATPFGGAQALDMEGTPPQRKKRGGLHVPLIGTGLLIVGVAAALFLLFSGDDKNSHVVRGRVGGSGNLGHSNRTEIRKATGGQEPDSDTDEPETSDEKGQGKTRKNTGGTKVAVKTDDPGSKRPTVDPDEVDLSGGTSTTETGPLDGDDLMQVYRKNQIAIKMCYERQLKKNPLLKVPKTQVQITVGLDGRVSQVVIPTLVGTPLGTCLQGRIKSWRFRQTTEVFRSSFPIVFGN